MSARENFVSIEGNLVADPVLRHTPSGKAVTTVTVATSERRLVKGEWVDGDTSYFDAVAWERLADNTCATFSKGDRVNITGALKQRSWDDKDTGLPRYKVEIAADAVNLSLRFATADIHKGSFGGMDVEGVGTTVVASSAKAETIVMEEPY